MVRARPAYLFAPQAQENSTMKMGFASIDTSVNTTAAAVARLNALLGRGMGGAIGSHSPEEPAAAVMAGAARSECMSVSVPSPPDLMTDR